MDSRAIRHKFLDFFKQKSHKIVASAPMVVKDDPTLMFTNAGMNQFKDYFLGNKKAASKRVADTQKCLRVSGKHNDLEEVGIDTYHHTMFEMLGNWSFGDYFKKEAIEWAWELLTDVYGLPKDRMYVTVFGGDKEDGLDIDNEAYNYWKAVIPEDRILYASKADNFWEMGDTGPCGPCSEIHIDIRPESELKAKNGRELVNQDHPLVMEIWNLVFIQFNRKSNGSLEPLPEKHVDTGMGFERLAMVIQGKTSNYDTDVFTPLLRKIESISPLKISYGLHDKTDVAFRVVSDHVRAVAFAIADGQLPSNTGAGYVIRRILRRAVRYGFTHLGFKEPFIYQLVEILSQQMGDIFPEMNDQKEFVTKVIFEEEQSFFKTLEDGLKKLDSWIEDSKKFAEYYPIPGKEKGTGRPLLSGRKIYTLYDTFGFPKDLTLLILKERNQLDLLKENWEEEFNQEFQKQKSRSKAAAEQEKGDWEILHDGDVEFVGYEHLTAESNILRYRKIKEKKKDIYQVVLDKTPFYSESGGQVGDTGWLMDGEKKYPVIDTKKENELIVHFLPELPEHLNATFKAVVDAEKRKLTENNHSCTHLMHAALKQVLGNHVQQRGSLVNDKILRFDFSHFSKVTDEELEEVERIVNEKIREDIPLEEKRNVPIQKAKEMGATALFGEKYGDYVRMITFDENFSRELCGGTHVNATGKIGMFKIISESSVAAGIRRIEAVTAKHAEEYVQSNFSLLNQIKEVLNNPKDPVKTLEKLINEKNQLTKEVEKYELEKAGQLKDNLKQNVQVVNGINLIIEKATLPNADALKKLSFELKNEMDNLLLVLAVNVNGTPMISVMISENLVDQLDLHAGNLVKEFAKEIKGGGGGQPFYATAGGKDVEGLDNVVKLARQKFTAKSLS